MLRATRLAILITSTTTSGVPHYFWLTRNNARTIRTLFASKHRPTHNVVPVFKGKRRREWGPLHLRQGDLIT